MPKPQSVEFIAKDEPPDSTGPTAGKNSQGGQVHGRVGIDLIANNDDTDLQPLVKGDNLVQAFNKLVDHRVIKTI